MEEKDFDLGQAGEEEAARYLNGLGLDILERNFRLPFGELDIIARHKDTLVFVEVRTKTTAEHGHPLETITSGKKHKIVKTAMGYLKKTGQYDTLARFDVVALIPLAQGGWEIEHIPNAFEVEQFS